MNHALNDHAYMAQALRLASKGMYTTRSNPRVGCVIVKQGEVIGQGFHVAPGQAHAEINALGSCINGAEDATVYVTLEPCSHQGKTPPCIDALLNAKISKVVSAMRDPNPLVNGKGLEFLSSNGVKTACNILEHQAHELNKGFVKRMVNGRPYVTVKSAISLDGKTALQSGESKWISSEESRIDVQKLRARSCAIMTGIGTVLVDDPNLTVRLNQKELGIDENFQQPKRIIIDTQLRIPVEAKILKTPEDVIIYTATSDNEKCERLVQRDITVVQVSKSNSKVDLTAVMKDLADREINELFVEAGSSLLGKLVEEELVDEMILFIAPHMLGDASRGLINSKPIKTMQDRINFEIDQVRRIGKDLKLILKPQY